MANSSNHPVPPGRRSEHLSLRSVRTGPAFLLVATAIAAVVAGAVLSTRDSRRPGKILGPTEVVEQVDAGALPFAARIDTGATTCSVHAAQWTISDEAETMVDNVGKVIRFCVENGQGGARWLERQIVEMSTITTSEGEEQRYKVFMTLRCQGVEKRVLVSLNDRSRMQYPLLIGRNFLEGDFLVDVSASSY